MHTNHKVFSCLFILLSLWFSPMVARPVAAQAFALSDLQPGSAMVGSAVIFSVRIVHYIATTVSCGLYLDGTYAGPMTLTGESAARVHVFSSAGTFAVEARCALNGAEQSLAGSIQVSSAQSATSSVSITASRLIMDRQLVPADGKTDARVTVVIRNKAGALVSGVPVSLRSSRGNLDVISPSTGITASDGTLVFLIHSGTLGIGYYTATADGLALAEAPTITFVAPGTGSNGDILPGNLIKLTCPSGAGVNDPCRAVYYFGEDRKRHAFPHEKVFYTWYSDFSAVQEVTFNFLSSLPLGRSVTYRPGIKLVKFVSLPKVYAVSPGGTLRWVTTEELTRALYGTVWNKRVDDISDAFFPDYVFGTDISSVTDYNPSVEADRSSTIYQDLMAR